MSNTMPPDPDPHLSKIAPDDPRLRLSRARGRTLKKGPAIALALALLGAVLVAMVIAMQPAKSPAEAKKAEAEKAPATQAPVVMPDSIRNAPSHPTVTGPPPLPNLGVVPLPDGGVPHRALAGSRLSPSNDPLSPERLRLQGREQELKARGAGILFEANSSSVPAAPSSGPPSSSASSAWLEQLGRSQSAPQSNAPSDADPNMQSRKNSFIDSEGASKTKDYLSGSIRHPKSPYEIKAGTIIPVVLITAINSDLPGPVVGQVRESVYDTVTGNHLLIPQGSRLLANYDSMVAWGQERILICWNRLILPNGDSVNLECMPAGDLEGAAGLTDEVNEHWWRIMKGAAVASLLAATATGIAGNTQGFNPTVPQMFARNAAGEVNQVGQQITRRNINIQPTITVRPGYSVNVMVTKDMIIPPYDPGSFTTPSTLNLQPSHQ